MSLRFYFDENVSGAITKGLRIRQIDVLTVQDDDRMETDDPILLDRATELERVMFSRDDDFLREAHYRQRETVEFPGVVYAHQRHVSIGECIADLELIARACDEDDLRNQVIHLPLT